MSLVFYWSSSINSSRYASSVFLWTLWSKRKNKHGSVTSSVKRKLQLHLRKFRLIPLLQVSFRMRLQTLFWIALSNFTIPALFSVAQIIVIYREVNPVIINQIILANTSIAVIGVVFATVWAGSVTRQISQLDLDPKPAAGVENSGMKGGVMHFATRRTYATHDEIHTTYQLPALSGRQDSVDDEFGKSDSERYGSPKSP